jgi:hypothetical protein
MTHHRFPRRFRRRDWASLRVLSEAGSGTEQPEAPAIDRALHQPFCRPSLPKAAQNPSPANYHQESTPFAKGAPRHEDAPRHTNRLSALRQGMD